jgi:hypothetical protein
MSTVEYTLVREDIRSHGVDEIVYLILAAVNEEGEVTEGGFATTTGLTIKEYNKLDEPAIEAIMTTMVEERLIRLKVRRERKKKKEKDEKTIKTHKGEKVIVEKPVGNSGN